MKKLVISNFTVPVRKSPGFGVLDFYDISLTDLSLEYSITRFKKPYFRDRKRTYVQCLAIKLDFLAFYLMK